jgi:RNA-directed DNA polymerase
MLTALEEGVKGGKWFSLIDKVYSMQNLRASFQKVKTRKGSAGVDHQTIEAYEANLEQNLEDLSVKIREERYEPRAVKRVWIPKPGKKEKRPLGIPTVRERVVQGAMRNVLEPIFEKDFAEHSYGFRPGRGCKDALRRVNALLIAGHEWVVDADIKGYFDTIPHEPLMDRLREKISDGKMLTLVKAFLNQAVMETAKEWTPAGGTPQGAVMSPLLANIYLDPLDHLMQEAGYEMVRYADDFVVLCRSQAEAEQALTRIRSWMEQAKLTLHPEKTRIVNVQEGFDFLGYHFENGRRWPSKKSTNKFKDAIRRKTKRTNGQSLPAIIAELNPLLRGWFEYFKHGNKYALKRLDGWIRMRLRSLMRKRIHLKGRGRGADHQRWPNDFFAENGLFNLLTAHAEACQSSRR